MTENLEALHEAAQNGDVEAMDALSTHYGEEGDDEQYFYWTKRCAEAGHMHSYIWLSKAYRNGIGTERDMDACNYWLQKAADEGDIVTKLMALGELSKGDAADEPEDDAKGEES